MLAAGAPLIIYDEIDSTILEARRRADRADYGPVWLMARKQSAGRGRQGRAWASLEGNLFATYLGRALKPPSEIALLGFAAGLAIAEALDAALDAEKARLKWPNDVLIDGAKICGILLDSGAVSGANWFALGFGVNIMSAPRGLDQPAVALADLTANAPTPEALLADIRTRLESWAARFGSEGFAPVREAWLKRAYGLGAPAQVKLGDEIISGVMTGLSARGELEVVTAAGLRVISAGDVHFPKTSAA